jgi:tetratricopeptide (TPR) repeat protein
MRRVVASFLLFLCGCVPLHPVKQVPKQKKATGAQVEEYKPKSRFLFYYMVYLKQKKEGNLSSAYTAIKSAIEESPGNIYLLLEAAKTAVDLRNLEDARMWLEKALSIEPKNVDALKLKAGILVAEGKRSLAEGVYREILSISPERDIYLMLTNLYMNEKEYTKAQKLLEEAQKHFPKDALVAYFQGHVAMLAGDKPRAIEHLKRAVELNPNLGSAYVLLGKLMVEEERYTEAEAFLKKVLAKHPDNVYALRELLVLYLSEGYTEGALKVMNRLMVLEPYDLKLLSWIAANLFKLKKYQQAIPVIERITKLNPDNPNVYFMLGLAREMAGKHEDALKAYRKSLKLYPENPTVLERVALLLYHLSRFRESKTYFERLWELTKKPQYLIRVAIITDRLGNTKEAYELLKVWEKELKTFPDLYFYLAYFAEKLRMDERTESYLKYLVEKHPTPDACNYLAYFYAQRGRNLDSAYSLVERALKEEPNNPAYIDTKGWILFKKGNLQEACSYLKKALSLKPQDPVINEHYGECLFKTGRKAQAKKHFLKAFVGVMKDPSIQEEERGILRRIVEFLKKLSGFKEP